VLLRAACVVGADPIYIAPLRTTPEGIDVALRPYGRVDLAALVVVALIG
jgi:hypothetical protein